MPSEDHAKLVSEQIRTRVKGGGETIYLSIMDKWGNVVYLTVSIERVYGAKVLTRNWGFSIITTCPLLTMKILVIPTTSDLTVFPEKVLLNPSFFDKRNPGLPSENAGVKGLDSIIAQVLIHLAK